MEGLASVRNKTLARTLEKIDIVEGWGSGLKRIFSQCEEYDIPYPVFVEIGDMLRVKFLIRKLAIKNPINFEQGFLNILEIIRMQRLKKFLWKLSYKRLSF